MQFSWDPKKAARNLKRHGVRFAEAVTVLENPLTEFSPDTEHDEPRLTAIGESSASRLLFVVCVERRGDHLRIISARKANSHERRKYEQRS